MFASVISYNQVDFDSGVDETDIAICDGLVDKVVDSWLQLLVLAFSLCPPIPC